MGSSNIKKWCVIQFVYVDVLYLHKYPLLLFTNNYENYYSFTANESGSVNFARLARVQLHHNLPGTNLHENIMFVFIFLVHDMKVYEHKSTSSILSIDFVGFVFNPSGRTRNIHETYDINKYN